MEKQYRGPDRVIENFPQPNDYEGPFPADQHVRLRQNYAAMIENIDRWLGIYVEELRKRGELDNTIIVYSSDHGEMLGDSRLRPRQSEYRNSADLPHPPGCRADDRTAFGESRCRSKRRLACRCWFQGRGCGGASRVMLW